MFDLILPDSPREGYGIRLTDRLQGTGTAADQPGDNTIDLQVRMLVDGRLGIVLRDVDFVANTTTVLETITLAPPTGADQIRLRLDHVANSTAVTALFEYLDNGVVVGGSTFSATGTVFQGEDWLRAQVIAVAPELTDSTRAGVYGTFTVNQAGAWSYTLANDQANLQALAAGTTVEDTFTVQVADGLGGTDTEAIVVQVTGTNDAPSLAAAIADQQASEGLAFNFALPAGTFADVDVGDSRTLSATGQPAWLTFNAATGTFSGTPSFSDAGTFDIVVTATDGSNARVSDTFTLTINEGTPPNLAPVADADGPYAATEDTTLFVAAANGVLNGDTDPESGLLTAELVTTTANGALTLNADSSFSYQPGTNFNGSDSFVYRARDTGGLTSADVTVQITVAAVNDAAVITGAASGTIDEDAVPNTVSGALAATDVDSLSTFQAVTNGTTTSGFGTFSINATGAWTYALDNANPTVNALSDASAPLTDTFTVTTADGTAQIVTVTVTGTTDVAPDVNEAPSFAVGDGKVTTEIGTTDAGYSGTLQADGKILVAGTTSNGSTTDFALVRYNADGSLDSTFDSDGTVTTTIGTSDAGYSVKVQPDGKILVAGFTLGQAGEFALVRYNPDGSLDTTFDAVNTLNGAPTFTEDGPAVVLDTSVAIFDAELAALVGEGDYGGASITLARQGGANADDVFGASGALSISGLNVILSGTTIGTQTQSDGALTISFNAGTTQAQVNAALSALTYANTSNAPPASATINWTFSDGNTGAQGAGGALATTGSTTVSIAAANDAPVITSNGGADTATISVAENATAVTTVTAVDPDLPAQPLTYSITGGADAAHFNIDSATGALSFVAAPNFEAPTDVGADNVYDVTVHVSDDVLVDTQAIAVTVTNVNDEQTAPAINSVTTLEDTSSAVVAIGADDVDGDALSYTVKSGAGPQSGSVSFNAAAGTFVYTPTANANGADSFTILIDDGQGAVSEQAVNVTITPSNDEQTAPTTNTVTTLEDAASAAIAIGATDIDGDVLTYTVKSGAGPQSGSVSFDGVAGTFIYTPTANANGADSFTILIDDGQGAVSEQVVSVSIAAVNDVAVIGGVRSGSVTEDSGAGQIATGALTVSDVDGAAEAAFQAVTITGTYGSLLLTGAGEWTYTLNNGLPALQALNAGQTLLDTILVRSVDNTASSVAITINGANEVATVITNGGAGGALTGTAGSDVFEPGGGNDTVNGGDGNDLILAAIGDGNDTYNGGAGIDTIDYSAISAVLTVDLAGNAGRGTQIGRDTLNAIENVIGGSGNDRITGNAADNRLEGRGGADDIFGGGGSDTLIGGAGNDTLEGGGGNDVFEFEAGFGRDLIRNFGDSGTNQDVLRFDDALFSDRNASGGIDFGDLGGLLVQVGRNVEIRITGTDVVVLQRVQLGNLSAGDFAFF